MEQFNLTDEQASKLERAAAGEVVDLTDDEASVLERVMAGGKQEAPAPLPATISPQQQIATDASDWRKNQATGTLAQGKDYSDLGHKAKAFSASVIPGYTAMAQGAQSVNRALGLPSMPNDQVQEDISRSVQENPGSSVAGSVAQQILLTPAKAGQALAALPTAAERAFRAAQTGAGLTGVNFLTKQSNVNADAPIEDTALGLANEMAIGGMTGGVAEKLIPTKNPFVEGVANRSARGVRDWTDRYVRDAVIDPETIRKLEALPSQKGLENRYYDILEEISTHVLPNGPVKGFSQSPGDMRLAARDNLRVGEDVLDAARAPMRIDVPDSDLASAMNESARDLDVRGVTGGADAANIVRDEASKLVGPQKLAARRPGDPSWTGQTNLQELERLATGIEAPNYQGALKASDPTRSTGLASDAMRETQAFEAAKQTGLDPFQLMDEDMAASGVYEAKRKAAEAVYGVEAKTALPPTPGFVSNSPLATGGRAVIQSTKDRFSRGIAGGSKKALNWATKKLNASSGMTGQAPAADPNLSPFQLESFKRQVSLLQAMSPGDFSVGLYAMSATDPVFNELWKRSQQEQDDE